jgi:hypothetical protein
MKHQKKDSKRNTALHKKNMDAASRITAMASITILIRVGAKDHITAGHSHRDLQGSWTGRHGLVDLA